MRKELWLPIPGYEPYMASNFGRIKGTKVLTPVLTQHGYHQVSLCVSGKKFSRFVHRLVAGAFIGPQPTPEHDVLHWDGDKTNNDLANLRWGTPLENNKDQERHGTRIKGSDHPNAKLDEGRVQAIRDLWHHGTLDQKAIAENFGVTRRTVNNIVRYKMWKHVA